MRRPPARRPRLVAAAVLTGLAACAEDERALPVVVAVAAQPCVTPNRSIGWGVVVDKGLVATAAHTVEGPLRSLSVDGHPARVAVLDARTDLALLAADLDAEPARITDASPRDATVAMPAGPIDVEVLRTGRWSSATPPNAPATNARSTRSLPGSRVVRAARRWSTTTAACSASSSSTIAGEGRLHGDRRRTQPSPPGQRRSTVHRQRAQPREEPCDVGPSGT